MKPQKAKEAGGKKLPVGMANQFDTVAAPREAARPAQSSVDDLHARITKRAYEQNLEGGCREGGGLGRLAECRTRTFGSWVSLNSTTPLYGHFATVLCCPELRRSGHY